MRIVIIIALVVAPLSVLAAPLSNRVIRLEAENEHTTRRLEEIKSSLDVANTRLGSMQSDLATKAELSDLRTRMRNMEEWRWTMGGVLIIVAFITTWAFNRGPLSRITVGGRHDERT